MPQFPGTETFTSEKINSNENIIWSWNPIGIVMDEREGFRYEMFFRVYLLKQCFAITESASLDIHGIPNGYLLFSFTVNTSCSFGDLIKRLTFNVCGP